MSSRLQSELVQAIEVRRRRIRLARGFNGTRTQGHESGPWRIVMAPHFANDDLGPDAVADMYDVCLELDNFSARAHWIIVDHDVAVWLSVAYVLVPMLRVGNPNPDGRWDGA